jgi:hypothetical protein
MMVKMVVRPIAKLIKRLAQGQLVHRHGRIMSSTIAVLAFR